MIKGTPQQIEAEKVRTKPIPGCLMTELSLTRCVKFSRAEMKRKLQKKQEIADKLIPKEFAVGCRVRVRRITCKYRLTHSQRPTPGNGYLETISDDRCDVTFSGVKEIVEDGVITEDGNLHKMDVLICATGFDVSFRPRYPVVGRDDVDLRDAFKDSPETYMSVTAPRFPNYFSKPLLYSPRFGSLLQVLTYPSVILGPFGPYGHGSVIPAVEAITRHIELVLRKFQREGIKSLDPKQEAVEDFKKHRQLFLKRTVWDAPCRAWFKLGKDHDNIMMWPGTRLHFFDILLNPRWEVSSLRSLLLGS